MSGYMPKVGDKVRATLGENVLVGVVRDDYVLGVPEFGSDQGYLLGFGLAEVWTWERDGWHFEQIVDVPTKFGAVIRRADGENFVLSSPHSFDCWYGGKDFRWTREVHATAGGFTVLFEGVDE